MVLGGFGRVCWFCLFWLGMSVRIWGFWWLFLTFGFFFKKSTSDPRLILCMTKIECALCQDDNGHFGLFVESALTSAKFEKVRIRWYSEQSFFGLHRGAGVPLSTLRTTAVRGRGFWLGFCKKFLRICNLQIAKPSTVVESFELAEPAQLELDQLWR